MKNCFPVLLCIICASITKHSLAAIILCVSLCLRDFCSSRRLLIKVLLYRLITKDLFFQISSLKKAVLYVVQCIFQKIKFYFQMCYLIDFVEMKHSFYNFLKRIKLSSSYFSKKSRSEFVQLISIIKSETPSLPPHLPKGYISQVSRTIQLDLHPLLSLLASFLEIFWQPF